MAINRRIEEIEMARNSVREELPEMEMKKEQEEKNQKLD